MRFCITILGVLLTVLLTTSTNAQNIQKCCEMQCPAFCLSMLFQQADEYTQKNDEKPNRGLGKNRPNDQHPNIDGGKRPRGANGRDRPITANMVEHMMEVAKEIDPELAGQLASLCEKDPEALHKIMRRQGHRLGSLIRLRESDPELFEMKVIELKTDAEIFHLAESMKGQDPTNPTTQAQIAQLEGLIRARTEIAIRAQSLFIERLEQHLAGLRDRLDDTAQRFDEIVDDRLNQLLKEVYEKEPQDHPSQSD